MKISSALPNVQPSQSSNTVQDSKSTQDTNSQYKQTEVKKVNDTNRTDISSDSVINDEMLDNSIKQANKALETHNKYIERTVHEKTHAIIYVLKDSLTQEVIREFPPKKIQDMIAKMWEIAGLIVDERR